MYYRQDWLMRQIDAAIAAILRMITKRDANIAHESSELFQSVMSLLGQGEICEAENVLFFAVEAKDGAALETGIAFYGKLNKMDDRQLEGKDFSRDEIKSGLKELCRANGIFHPMFL